MMKRFIFYSLALVLIILGFSVGFLQAQNTLYGTDAGINLTSGGFNTLIGARSGFSLTEGSQNTFLGFNTGYNTTLGGDNVFLGNGAGYTNTNGNYNVFVGRHAGRENVSGNGNTALGYYAGHQNAQGDNNVFVGRHAGEKNTNDGNTYVGYKAGQNNVTGHSNVFIGRLAGREETGSNKLYIANGPSEDNTLIYGDFNTDRVGIGTLEPIARLDLAESADDNETDFLHIREFTNTLPGAYVTRFIIKENGQVGIGTSGTTSVADGYILSVNGKTICEELKVQNSTGWPDYVFDTDYQLTSLEAAAAHIQKSGHLHQMPSAAQIEQDKGFELGEMTRKQQEKIEEIFLHLIKMDERIKELETENARLKAMNNE